MLLMQCTGESPLEGKLPPKLAKMFFAVELQPPSSDPYSSCTDHALQSGVRPAHPLARQ